MLDMAGGVLSPLSLSVISVLGSRLYGSGGMGFDARVPHVVTGECCLQAVSTSGRFVSVQGSVVVYMGRLDRPPVLEVVPAYAQLDAWELITACSFVPWSLICWWCAAPTWITIDLPLSRAVRTIEHS